jgi:hypothetical protein
LPEVIDSVVICVDYKLILFLSDFMQRRLNVNAKWMVCFIGLARLAREAFWGGL